MTDEADDIHGVKTEKVGEPVPHIVSRMPKREWHRPKGGAGSVEGRR